MGFSGFPMEAVMFYEGLAADNSRVYWQANKPVYDRAVRAAMEGLLTELADYGPFHVFRPNRDVRFAKDKTPYKDAIGAFGESQGGAGYFVQFSAAGMLAGSGYYHMAADQLERFRRAVDRDATGAEIDGIVADLEASGLQASAIDALKTAPRGYAKDHPRIALLRRKGLVATRRWDQAKWMRTGAVVTRVRHTWAEAVAMSEWLDVHVGPSTIPPDDASSWRR
ncbi:MAG: DUF2461 domain-containing protein [Ilumatobacteraceae bacterium]